MRYGGRGTSVIESRGHRSYYKQCNRTFPVWGIFSWRAENLLESRSPRPGRFRDSSNGLWETFIFLLFPRVINVITGKVGESISTIIIVAPLVAIMKPKTQAIWNNSNNSHRLGTGGRHGRRHGNVKGRCACHHLWKPRKAKKVLFERLFGRNKKINALTEVKENQYFTASGIKFFQKQTAGNNYPLCMTDRLNVRLRATEIRVA